MKFRRAAVLSLALLALPLLAACVSVQNPTGWAPVTFDGDTAYLQTSKGHLTALAVNGDSAIARWTFPDKDRDEDDKFKTSAIYGAPVVEGDRVYLATFHGGVFALSKQDGRPIWPGPDGNASEVDGDIPGGVALDGDFLYFGTTEGKLYAWNKNDGKPKPGWEEPKSFGSGIWATPVVAGDTLFVATMEGDLHGVSIETGEDRWEPFKATGAIADIALVNDELLFVPSINRHVYLIRTADGSLAGDFRAQDWVWTSPAVSEQRIYFGDFGGEVYRLDITGSMGDWKPVSLDGERVKAGAAIIDGVLVVADRKPVVTFIDAANGSVLNRVPITDAGTVRADVTPHEGNAFIATTKGRLFRAEPEARKVVEIQLSGVKK